MTITRSIALPSMVCSIALLTACPGTDTPAVTTGADSGSTGRPGTTTTSTATGTDTLPGSDSSSSPGTTMVDPDTTGGSTEGTTGDTTEDPSTGTTTSGTTSGTDGGSSSGGTTGGSGSEGSSGGTTGGPLPMGFGDCVTMAPMDACIQPEEQCLVDVAGMPTVGVCTWIGCTDAGDCPPAPPGGTAPVVCQDINGDMVPEECSLDCSAGQTCPTGMDCFAGFICAWPA